MTFTGNWRRRSMRPFRHDQAGIPSHKGDDPEREIIHCFDYIFSLADSMQISHPSVGPQRATHGGSPRFGRTMLIKTGRFELESHGRHLRWLHVDIGAKRYAIYRNLDGGLSWEVTAKP